MRKKLLKNLSRPHGYWIHRHRLAKTQWWDEERQETYALQQLSYTLSQAGEGTRFYRERFREVGFDPRGDLKSTADLAGLPLLTKEEIRADSDALIDRRHWRFSMPAETSGTTGEPLRMRLNEGFVAFDSACIFRHWSWAGYQWRDPMVALRSYVPHTLRDPLWRLSRAQNTLFFSAYHLTPTTCKTYLDRILRFRPKYIKAYPSSVTLLAEFAYDERERFEFLEGIFVSSETLLPTEREAIERTFGRKVFNWYGMTEPAMVFTECAAHEGMHLNWEYGYAELMPSDELAPDEYRLIATGYHNPVMPFIRYDTGDVVRVSPNARRCSCGRPMPLVETVVGRKDEAIVTPDGRRLPSVNFYTVFRRYSEVLRFQIVQYGRREVSVKLNLRPGSSDAAGLLARIRDELMIRLGPQVELTLEATDRFVTNADGKTPPILRRSGSRSIEEKDEYAVSSQVAWQADRQGQAIRKLDWNEPDRVASPRVREKLLSILENDRYLYWYPEADSPELSAKVAAYAGIHPAAVLLTHGSDSGMEAIATAFVRPGDAVVFLSPTYDNFRSVVEQRGAELARFRYHGTDEFPLQAFVELLRARSPRLVYLNNPNNPIGYLLERPVLERVAEYCARIGCVLVVDEAYIEFSGGGIADLAAAPGSPVVVCRTFSKAFGLAGLRLGYLVGSPESIRVLRRVANPKSVTMLAKAAALAALDDLEAVRAYIEEVRAAREDVYRGLTELDIGFYPSTANFVLFRWPQADQLVRALSDQGVLVRDRTRYFDGEGHIRVSVTGGEGARAFLGALRQYLTALTVPTGKA